MVYSNLPCVAIAFLVCTTFTSTDAAFFAPLSSVAKRVLVHSRSDHNRSSSQLQALPPQKPLNEYPPPTNEAPHYGYSNFNPRRSIKTNEVSGYVEGAPIDELFKLASDFTKDSAFWKKTLDFTETYSSGAPNDVGSIRDFIYIGKTAQYVEMLSHCDPEAYTFTYASLASNQFVLNALLTTVSMVDDPENNRVKVTWAREIQTAIPFFLVRGRQKKADELNIEILQSFFPVTKE